MWSRDSPDHQAPRGSSSTFNRGDPRFLSLGLRADVEIRDRSPAPLPGDFQNPDDGVEAVLLGGGWMVTVGAGQFGLLALWHLRWSGEVPVLPCLGDRRQGLTTVVW